MKINLNITRPEGQDAGPAVKGASGEAAAVQAGDGSAGAVARFSADLSRVPDLVTALASLPEIRQEKVSALQQAVRAGTYQVAPEHTAEAVLRYIETSSAA
jgi:flagellar biosynthesis anti-sigma factor FlgM